MVDPLDEVVVETATESESERSDIHYDDTGFDSLQRDSLVKSNFEDTENCGGNVHIYNTDTTTNLSDPPHTSIPKKVRVTQALVLLTESTVEEVRTSVIHPNISDIDTIWEKG